MIYQIGTSKLRINLKQILIKRNCMLEYLGANGYTYPLSKMGNDPEIRFSKTLCLWKEIDKT